MYINGILYKKRKVDSRLENGLLINLVIPTTLMIKCLKAIHCSSHDDLYHTLFKFKLDYYHPHERSFIQKFINDCEVCKLLKGKPTSPIKIMSAPIANRPFQCVSMDFVGPLPYDR